MNTTPESIADLIAAHRDGAVSTLALYDKLRALSAGCATLEKKRDELQAELTAKNDAAWRVAKHLSEHGKWGQEATELRGAIIALTTESKV